MIDRFVKGRWYACLEVALLAGACLITWTGQEVIGAVIYILLVAILLALSSDLTVPMLPAMLLSVFITKCYDSASTMIRFAWVAVPFIAAVCFHFIRYRKPMKRGASFPGLIAISAALLLGGLGTLPISDYLTAVNLFYVLGLGVGMVAFYLLVRSGFDSDSAKKVIRVLYFTGILAVFCVIRYYLSNLDTLGSKMFFELFQSSNNLSTFLMLTMPIPFYYARRNPLHLLSSCVMYAAILATASRGGLLMGSIEFALILIVYAGVYRKTVWIPIVCSAILLGTVTLGVLFFPKLASFIGIAGAVGGQESAGGFLALIDRLKEYFFSENEVRRRLLPRMMEDFKRNPVFGSGLANQANVDVYQPKPGAMTWYHMWFAQVVGSMGLLGIAAYGYQLVSRFRLFFLHRNAENLTFLLSYIGLFLMSQVNPGEFCPLPYAALAVTYFLCMEISHEKQREHAETGNDSADSV